MKQMFLMAVVSLGLAFSAYAEPALVSGCKVQANVSGLDAAVIIGVTAMEGEGTVTCHNPLSGRTTRQRVGILIGGVGIGPQIALPTFQPSALSIYAVSAGVTTPNAMYGEFHLDGNVKLRLLSEQASTGAGVAISAKNALGATANVNLKLLSQASFGLGGEFGVSTMTIMSRREYRAYKWRQQQQQFDRHSASN